MRKPAFFIIAIFFVSIFAGCYESPIPLSSSRSAVIDEKLAGYWLSVPEAKDEKKIFLAVFKFNENEYLVSWREGEDDTILARGFITKIDNTNIMNVQNIKSLEKDDRTYVFFKYDFTGHDNLRVRILSGETSLLKNKKFKSSKEFYSYIKKNLGNDELFGKTVMFKPAKKISLEITP